jgi:prevent-host-death family protein
MLTMKTLSSTEARKGFSAVINSVKSEPVTISKKNKPVAVVMSSARYQELKRLEDILYGKAAELAIKEGFAPKDEVDELFSRL